MERVAFLLEDTGTPIHCLLNPDSLVVRRLAGLQPRRTAGGLVTGTRLTDDPLLVTGGGRTEIELDLLFDVTLPGVVLPSGDVRELTGPFWDLAENAPQPDDYGAPRLVRFVWGKNWNVPAVVAAVSERFESFTTTGIPQRSWLRMRLLRTGEPAQADTAAPGAAQPLPPTQFEIPEVPDDQVTFHEVVGSEDQPAQRLDEIANIYYGEPGLWRAIAQYNGVTDPLNVPPPNVLRIPPIDVVRALG
jgi:hypothetical protein